MPASAMSPLLKLMCCSATDSCVSSGLHLLEDNVGARLTLASLLLEDDKVDETISLLSPPENPGINQLVIVVLIVVVCSYID